MPPSNVPPTRVEPGAKKLLRLLTAQAGPVVAGAGLLRLALVCVLLMTGLIKPFLGFNAETGFLPLAERLLTTGTFNDPADWEQTKYTPGYPLLIAAMRAGGASASAAPAWMVVVQNAAEALTAWLLYLLARRRFGPSVAVTAALLWLTFPPAAIMSVWITTETLFITFLLAGLWLLAGEADGPAPSVLRLAVAGLVLGLGTLVRPTPLMLLPAWILLVFWRFGLGRAAIFAAMYAAVVGPWVVRNSVVFDDHFGVAATFGSVFLQGSDEEAFDGRRKTAAYGRWTIEAENAGLHKPAAINKPSESERWMMQLGWEQYRKRWRNRPWSYPRFLLTKCLRLWYGSETESTGRDLGLLALSALLALPGLFWLIHNWLGSGLRDIPLFDQLVMVLLAYFIALHVLSLPMIRYMLPVYPLLFIGTAQLLLRLVAKAGGTVESGVA